MKGWFVNLQVNGGITTFSRAMREEAGAVVGQMTISLGFREYPIPCPTVNPTCVTQTSSLGQTPPRPLSLRKTEKNAIEQDAWKVKKDGFAVFVLFSCWKHEHRTIKLHVPAKCLKVTAFVSLSPYYRIHWWWWWETAMHKQGAPLSPCSCKITLSQELHCCSSRCYLMWCPKFSTLVYCFHLFPSRFLHKTIFPSSTDNAMEKSHCAASSRAFDLPSAIWGIFLWVSWEAESTASSPALATWCDSFRDKDWEEYFFLIENWNLFRGSLWKKAVWKILASLHHARVNSTIACLQDENTLLFFCNIKPILLTSKGEEGGSCVLCMFCAPTSQELPEK